MQLSQVARKDIPALSDRAKKYGELHRKLASVPKRSGVKVVVGSVKEARKIVNAFFKKAKIVQRGNVLYMTRRGN